METPTVVSPSDILTVEELAKSLKVPLSWVYEAQRSPNKPRIPTIKIGRYLRFDWKEVSAWLRARSTAQKRAA